MEWSASSIARAPVHNLPKPRPSTQSSNVLHAIGVSPARSCFVAVAKIIVTNIEAVSRHGQVRRHEADVIAIAIIALSNAGLRKADGLFSPPSPKTSGALHRSLRDRPLRRARPF
jgi:hypothetical protein